MSSKIAFLLVGLLATESCAQRLANIECGLAPQRSVEFESGSARHLYFEAPQVVGGVGDYILWGHPALEWTVGSRGPERFDTGQARLLGVRVVNGKVMTRISPPANLMLESWPRLAQTGDSIIHVVWLESTESTERQPHEDRLMYSRLTSNGWTSPLRIYTATRINWAPGEASDLTPRGNDLHLAISSTRTNRGTQVAILHLSNQQWTVDENAEYGMPDFVSLVIDRAGRPIISFSQSDPSANASNGSHPYLRRSGVTTSARLRWSGLGGVTFTNLIKTRDGIALIWRQRGARGMGDSVAIMFTRDEGKSWTPAVLRELPAGARSLTAARDATGDIQVVFWTNTNSIGRIAWTKAGWIAPEILPFGEAGSYPTLLRFNNNLLRLAWGASLNVAGAAELPTTRIANFDPGC
jgi:hypothetical protein